MQLYIALSSYIYLIINILTIYNLATLCLRGTLPRADFMYYHERSTLNLDNRTAYNRSAVSECDISMCWIHEFYHGKCTDMLRIMPAPNDLGLIETSWVTQVFASWLPGANLDEELLPPPERARAISSRFFFYGIFNTATFPREKKLLAFQLFPHANTTWTINHKGPI